MLTFSRHLSASLSLFFLGSVGIAGALPALSISGREIALDRANLTHRDAELSVRLERRFSNARFSFYDAGLGACGEVNSNSDFIVALNAAQWNDRAHCGQTVTISYGGRTARARIMDLCPGCPYGGLDLSRGLFSYFASQELGIIQGSWDFGGSAGDTPSPPPPVTSSSRGATSTRTTSTRTTSTSTRTTSTRTRSTTSTESSSTASDTTTPRPTPTPTPTSTTSRVPTPSSSSPPSDDRPSTNALNALRDSFLRFKSALEAAGGPSREARVSIY